MSRLSVAVGRRGGLLLVAAALLLLLGPAPIRPATARVASSSAIGTPPPYGTNGKGNPRTADCTTVIRPGHSIDAGVRSAPRHGVVCVRPGDYRTQIVHLNRAGITVRSNGVAKIRGALVTGDRATLDGFTIVGGAYGHPQAGITFGGEHQRILRNLINGRQLVYGIDCIEGKCNHALVAHNTVTNIQNYGMFIDAGTGCLIEWNNIYDLYTPRLSGYADDVDAIRFWGHHVFRHNYLHDINQFKSKPDSTGDTPHTDCFQTYNNGTDSVGTIIEDNYCVRVSRQCLIAQNDTDKRYSIRDIWFRNNVCETYDSQAINLGSMKGVHIQNNLILSGFRYQVVSLEEQDTGLANTDTTITNNVLVRAKKSAFTYERIGKTTHEYFRNNLELLDTSIEPRDKAFQSTRNRYPAFRASDFTSYRRYVSRLEVMDRGVPGNTARTDLGGHRRVVGRAIDLGPYELGGCGQRC